LLAERDSSQEKAWKRHDWEFHQDLISNCKSANLLSLHASLCEKIPARKDGCADQQGGAVAAKEHLAMLESVLTRKVKSACEGL
jgi:DNA-binding GntR family transcriptional regulator